MLVSNVPECQVPSASCVAPCERGKNSYHEPYSARLRSTQIG